MLNPEAPIFSPETLELFRQLLAQVKISAASDDLETVAMQVVRAKRELAVALGSVAVVSTPELEI